MHIYKVYFSEKDSLNLVGRESPKKLKEDVDFMKWVVRKPWGYEYLLYNNLFTQVWSLYIKQDALTSMHTHPNKKTALILVNGDATFSTFNTSIQLKPLDAVIIDPAVYHQTRATSSNGAVVIEVENPGLKYDLIRLKDKYGREGKFYEGVDQMYTNDQECVRFDELTRPGLMKKPYYDSILSVKKIANCYSEEDRHQFKDQDLMVVLEGNVHSKNGHLLYSVVDVIKCSDFIESLDSHVINNLSLLLIKNSHHEVVQK